MATKRSLLLKTMMICDLFIMIAAFGIATWSAYQVSSVASIVSFDNFLSYRIKISNILLIATALFCWHFIFDINGLYRSHRLSTKLAIARGISIATVLGTFILFLASKIFDINMITPTFLGIFWLTSTTLLLASRLSLRTLLKRIRLAGRNLRHVVVIGTNSRAREYVDQIKLKPELGYHFIGFVDDGGEETQPGKALPIVADYDQFAEFARENIIDEIVVFSPLRSQYDKVAGIVSVAESMGILLRFGVNPFLLKIGRSVVEQVGDIAVSSVQTGSMYDNPSLGAKALLDILVAATLIILLSPLLLVVAALIKLESPGPVFFVQKRLGLGKRLFNIYKFRTMSEDAEQRQADLEQQNEMSGPVFKIRNDPRITPLGKFLRKTSIDELPQLFNVLKGDMSLVGPRPLPVRDFKGFESDIHRRRFSVKPGITCLWQISGRNNISFEQWMELDMNYIDRWSFWLDLKILLKTIPAVLTRTGAE